MEVRVDAELCQGHTLCAMMAPKVFELSDIDGHSSAMSGEVPGDQRENVREAVYSCPERAISITE